MPLHSFVQTERQFTGQGYRKPHGGSPGSKRTAAGIAAPDVPGQWWDSHKTERNLCCFVLFFVFDNPGRGKNRSSF